MMPVGLKDSVQVMGYVPADLKERIVRLKDADRRMSMSRVIEQALDDYMPKIERELYHPLKPQPKRPKSH